ncbi:MAG: HAMP domain-containing histidine kinase [Pontibacter sp.]|nr:HAMP domain-containing histidine kinase [Pontibacter sp.]
MKLLHKTTLLYLLTSSVILLVASVTLMLVLRQLVDDEMDEELRLQYDMIAEQLAHGDTHTVPMSKIEVVPASEPSAEVFGDSVIYDRVQQLNEEYKYLRKIHPINGQNYRITVMDAHVEWQEFYRVIFLVFMITAALLVIAGAVINYVAARTIWRPFFLNLNMLKKFSVSAPQPLKLRQSNVREFEELRAVLEEMTRKSWQEFTSLREFTENASHETQTPLAIIRSKLDRLSQFQVSEEMAEQIMHAKSGVERLSRMNKSLLLLARLDNNAYPEKQEVQLGQLLREQVSQMEELFGLRAISLHCDIREVCRPANKYLVEVLVSNLLSNALRYTPQSGEVTVKLGPEGMGFLNTGPQAELPQEQLFERFRKGRQSDSSSTGLGLAIVYEICRVHGWVVSYTYTQGTHSFTISF